MPDGTGARQSGLEPALRLLLWLGLAGMAAWALRYAAAVVGFPYQIDWREAAPLRSALAISQGRNPWDPAWVAQDGSVYGLGFPWLAAKLLPQAWITLAGLRALSLALLAMAAAVAACGRKAGASRLGAAAAGLMVFGGLLFSVTPLGRGDALAVAGLVGPLALVALAPGRRWALAAAAALAALGLLAKAYAGFALVWVVLYLWIRGRRGEAGLFILAWGLAAAAGAALALHFYPGSLEATFITVNVPGWLQWYWMRRQNLYYLMGGAWPLPLLLAGALLRARPDREGWAWLAVLGSAVAVIELLLGRNMGAILTYYFQFLHPAAALCLLALAARPGRPEPLWTAAGLALAAGLTLSLAAQPLEPLAQMDLGPWRQADAWVAAARRPYLPQLFCSMATAHGKPVYDNGHTLLFDGPGPGPRALAMRAAVEAQQADWKRALDQAGCDLVLLERNAQVPTAVLKGYRREGVLCVRTPANIWQHAACFDVYGPTGAPDLKEGH